MGQFSTKVIRRQIPKLKEIVIFFQRVLISIQFNEHCLKVSILVIIYIFWFRKW